jgi:hypothetical protein
MRNRNTERNAQQLAHAEESVEVKDTELRVAGLLQAFERCAAPFEKIHREVAE